MNAQPPLEMRNPTILESPRAPSASTRCAPPTTPQGPPGATDLNGDLPAKKVRPFPQREEGEGKRGRNGAREEREGNDRLQMGQEGVSLPEGGGQGNDGRHGSGRHHGRLRSAHTVT